MFLPRLIIQVNGGKLTSIEMLRWMDMLLEEVQTDGKIWFITGKLLTHFFHRIRNYGQLGIQEQNTDIRGIFAHFPFSSPISYRFLRITSTGKNTHDNDHLLFSYIEFNGTLMQQTSNIVPFFSMNIECSLRSYLTLFIFNILSIIKYN